MARIAPSSSPNAPHPRMPNPICVTAPVPARVKRFAAIWPYAFMRMAQPMKASSMPLPITAMASTNAMGASSGAPASPSRDGPTAAGPA